MPPQVTVTAPGPLSFNTFCPSCLPFPGRSVAVVAQLLLLGLPIQLFSYAQHVAFRLAVNVVCRCWSCPRFIC